MTSTQSLTDPALAAVLDARDWQRQAEVASLVAVLDWATAHEVTGDLGNVLSPGLRLGGVGCPTVSEYDAWDVAAVLGQSPDAFTRSLGYALELRHRIPRLWERVPWLEVLGLLCRGHHRTKTFSQWSYRHLHPGVYVWHSAAGATYVVDRTSWP